MNAAPDRYCVLGNPVAHSLSPWIQQRFAELSGQALHYEKRLIAVDGFAAAVRGLAAAGVRGCNVTLPFKFEAAALATQLSPRAALAGAANTLTFNGQQVLADNTDGIGLVRDLQGNADCDLSESQLLLLGAGGAAAGVLGALIEAHPQSVVVANRTAGKAAALVQRHRALALHHQVELRSAGLGDIEGCFDVLINATSSSLGQEPLRLPANIFKPGALACDLMYGPAAQLFMAWARRHGAHARDGLGMLVEQAAESFFIWRGLRPASGQVLAELAARLARA